MSLARKFIDKVILLYLFILELCKLQSQKSLLLVVVVKSLTLLFFFIRSPRAVATEEVARYLSDPGDVPPDCDILQFWRKRAETFPLLSSVARNMLAIPASNTTSERSFSVAGRVLEPRRCLLSPDTVDDIMVLNGDIR